MTNADVISLAKGGFNDDLIIAAIQRSQNKVFDLSTDGMLSMKKAGVSQRVIAVMLTVPRPLQLLR